MMTSRTRSIFSLGDQEGDTEERGDDQGHGPVLTSCEPAVPAAGLVGLRLLIHRPEHETAGVVVSRSAAVRFSRRVPVVTQRPPQRHCSPPELSFRSGACHLCRKKLSPLQDIYMYRGDQGFCSVECRCKQMLLDDRRDHELELAGARRGRGRSCCAGHWTPSTSDHRRGRMSAAT